MTHTLRRFITLSLMLIVPLALSACAPTAVPTAVVPATSVPTEVSGTPNGGPNAPTEAPTAAPTAEVPATTTAPPVPAVTTSPASTPARIRFAPGATMATVQGQLPANGTQQYVVNIGANQLMEVDVTPQQGLQLSVYGADGTVLQPSNPAFFRGTVPSTQDYILALTAGNQAVSYTMDVLIPARISFAAGATSARVQGAIPANDTGHYVVKAGAGQTMTINTSTTQGQVILIVYGADGTVLLTDHAGASSFSGQLPSTQDYLIDVRSVGSVAARYTLKVTIPPK